MTLEIIDPHHETGRLDNGRLIAYNDFIKASDGVFVWCSKPGLGQHSKTMKRAGTPAPFVCCTLLGPLCAIIGKAGAKAVTLSIQ